MELESGRPHVVLTEKLEQKHVSRIDTRPGPFAGAGPFFMARVLSPTSPIVLTEKFGARDKSICRSIMPPKF